MAKDLKIRVGADTKDAESGLKRTASELKAVGTEATAAANAANKLSGGMAGTTKNLNGTTAAGKSLATSLGTIGDKIDNLDAVGVPGMGRLSAKANALSGSLTELGSAGTLAAVGIAAIASITTLAINEASEGEQASVRLNAALKAQGLYSEETAANIEEWSKELLTAKGVSDELSATLVAQGVVMGLSVVTSERYISLAADMADIVGSTEAAFDQLSRAASGDERAMKMLGRQFGIVVGEGTRLEDILAKIEKKTAGNAVAQVHTFAGEWKLLKEEMGNFLEEVGTPMMHWLAAQPSEIRRAGAAWKDFFEDFKAAGGDPIINFFVRWQEWADKAATSNERFWNTQGMLQSGHGYAEAMTTAPGHGEGVTPTKDPNDHGIFYEYRDYEEGIRQAKQAREEATRKAEEAERESRRKATEEEKEMITGALAYRAEVTRQQIDAEGRQRKKMLSENVWGIQESGGFRYGEAEAKDSQFDAHMASQREDEKQYYANLDAEDEKRTDQFKAHMEQQDSAYAAYVVGLDEKDEKRTDQFKAHLSRQSAAYADYINDKDKKDEEAAATLAASLGNAVASAIYSVGSGGDMESALGGLAVSSASSAASSAATSYFGSEFGKAAGAAAGPIFGALAGTGVSLITDSLFGSGPSSVGGQLREQLSDALSDIGLSSQTYQPATDEAFYATGQADFWQKMSEQIVGSDLIGEGGQMLMGAFDGLDLSMTDTISVMGGLIATAQGLTDVQGEQLAAQTALLSNAEFTRDELGQLAQSFGDASNYIKREGELQQQIIEEAQAYADATGAAKDEALEQLAATRAEYVGLLATQASDQKASDDALQAALEANGMSAEDASDIVRSNHTVEQNTGEMVGLLESINTAVGGTTTTEGGHSGIFPAAHSGQWDAGRGESIKWVRNDELIAPPEQFGRAARYLADRGFYAEPPGGSGGGGNVYQFSFPNYLGSQREVAEIMSREMATLERRKKAV